MVVRHDFYTGLASSFVYLFFYKLEKYSAMDAKLRNNKRRGVKRIRDSRTAMLDVVVGPVKRGRDVVGRTR